MVEGSAESDRSRFRCRPSRRTLSLHRPGNRPAGTCHGAQQLKDHPASALGVFWVTAEVCVQPQPHLHVVKIIGAQFQYEGDRTGAAEVVVEANEHRIVGGRPFGRNTTDSLYSNVDIWPCQLLKSGRI